MSTGRSNMFTRTAGCFSLRESRNRGTDTAETNVISARIRNFPVSKTRKFRLLRAQMRKRAPKKFARFKCCRCKISRACARPARVGSDRRVAECVTKYVTRCVFMCVHACVRSCVRASLLTARVRIAPRTNLSRKWDAGKNASPHKSFGVYAKRYRAKSRYARPPPAPPASLQFAR